MSITEPTGVRSSYVGFKGLAPAPVEDFYGSSRLTPTTLAQLAAAEETWAEILAFHDQLATDRYVSYVDGFYRECSRRFGRHWFYLDIVNVLYAAAKALQPKAYLEIGVRRGRSACTVARACPAVDMVACDMWQPGYAGMANPGPAFVEAELRKHGHRGEVHFLNGDSHRVLPEIFDLNPSLRFDLITVDGDHTEAGAMADLRDVLPRLNVGGVIVFDDIAHPAHPYLARVWRQAVAEDPGLVSYEFGEIGYGVAFAIRMTG
ncbi:MAG: class I SAM-dependent methyltransferase [Myxococcota bacterium]